MDSGFLLEAGELNKKAAHSSHMAIKEASRINTVFKVIEDLCRARYFTQVRGAQPVISNSLVHMQQHFMDQFIFRSIFGQILSTTIPPCIQS